MGIVCWLRNRWEWTDSFVSLRLVQGGTGGAVIDMSTMSVHDLYDPSQYRNNAIDERNNHYGWDMLINPARFLAQPKNSGAVEVTTLICLLLELS